MNFKTENKKNKAVMSIQNFYYHSIVKLNIIITVLSCNKLILQFRYAILPACAVTFAKFSPKCISSKCGPYLKRPRKINEFTNWKIKKKLLASLIKGKCYVGCDQKTYIPIFDNKFTD